jgi:hypothetical protein
MPQVPTGPMARFRKFAADEILALNAKAGR